MAAKKVVAVFLMCMVVLATVHVPKAEATADQDYKECYNACNNECFQDGKGNGYTFCEMKCDEECGTEEIKAKLIS